MRPAVVLLFVVLAACSSDDANTTNTASGSDPVTDTETPLPSTTVILRRVDETWDCARLADERDDLFPPTPGVDW